jgi:hypothetical protein
LFAVNGQTYQNFVIPAGQTWTITGLFSNDLLIPPGAGVFPSAVWELRSGMSAGNGGAVIAGGSSAVVQTPTGRSFGPYTEYNTTVTGLGTVLGPGTYWMNVAPANNPNSAAYNSNTFGLNSVGTSISNQQFFNSPAQAINFQNANDFGPFPNLSDGVIGHLNNRVPEIDQASVGGALAFLIGGVLALRGRRRLAI